LLAVALLASLYFFQDMATELRPDPLQNLFWLAGLLLFCAALDRPRTWLSLSAGAFFGLAALTNLKAVIGPIFVLGFLLATRPGRWAETLGETLKLAAGAALPYGVVLVYFGMQGALGEFHSSNLLFNLVGVLIDRDWAVARANLAFLLSRQLPFVALAGVGVWSLVTSRGQAGARTLDLLAVVGTAVAACWIINHFYPQWWLICMPLLCVVAIHGLAAAAPLLQKPAAASGALPETVPAVVLAALSLAYLLGMAVARTPIDEHVNLGAQRRVTATVLAETATTEPVGLIWSNCGGYMFNANLQYYWASGSDIGAAVRRYAGVDVNGTPWIERLESGRVRFVIGRHDAIYAGLPQVTRDYLAAHYDYEECLWRRKP
jgi:hypothetical protein